MTIKEITEMPTTLAADTANSHRYHESLFRSSHIVDKVKEWLAAGVPQTTILELIEHMESFPQKDRTL